ncbi:MAG: zinc-dependent alcohol dehydrogenase family protein [Spirochaetota bacterium]|nr:MAG: zinc-dependent alcohol dehydrogenase family protein [Spirochaetota bacterium]
MRAMILTQQKTPLELKDIPIPSINSYQVLVKVRACAVCRTDLHVIDGDLLNPKLPLVPGHEIIGEVVKAGDRVKLLKLGDRVGIPWLGFTCGTCAYCRGGKENLCENALFTGYTLDGGYAEYVAADERYSFPIPEGYPDIQAAPLLCAGLIGFRSLRMTGKSKRIGMYGFGAAAHILIQIAHYKGMEVFAFTKPGDQKGQDFALGLGAKWAGDSLSAPPMPLGAAIIFAPVGDLVPLALQAVVPGGIVVCAGIHMSDIPSFPYKILWEERVLRSVANLNRRDGQEFFDIALKVPVRTEVMEYPLSDANKALSALREGTVNGAAVLVI